MLLLTEAAVEAAVRPYLDARDQPRAYDEGWMKSKTLTRTTGEQMDKQVTHWLPAITPTSLQSHVSSGEAPIGYS